MSSTGVRRISLGRAIPLILVGVAVLVTAAILLNRRVAQAAPDQPIAFNHRTHADAGIQCLFCHPNAMRSDVAGIPSVQRCVGCHQTIASSSARIKTVLSYWERSEPIPWAPVTQMADFVFFSHQPHLSAGVNCETCHGVVGKMSVVRPVVTMDMGWCLDCHLKQPEPKVARLTDCLACHK
ncbi:MAG TPA: cytochrome c3 family protein [Anaerolineales bacterium]|jgi:hypothetical protein|nr:cytochrome c3 family protein [Anaerolineales bacterium]